MSQPNEPITIEPGKQLPQSVTCRVRIDSESREHNDSTTCCSCRRDYNADGKPWPLMLFLHGLGESGDNELERVKIHGPPKIVESRPDFPFVVVTPQCPPPPGDMKDVPTAWKPEPLIRLVDHVDGKSEHRPDARVCHRPEHGRLRHVATRGRAPGAVRGGRADLRRRRAEADGHVAAPRADLGVSRCARRRRAARPKARKWSTPSAAPAATCDSPCIPNVEHDSWTPTYDNPEVYDGCSRTAGHCSSVSLARARSIAHRLEPSCVYARVTRADAATYRASPVTPGQSSVRNGVTGRPTLLYRLHTGLSAQA